MAQWDFAELKRLCYVNNREFPDDFLQSLPDKQLQIQFHVEEAERIFKDIFKKSSELGDEKQGEALVRYISHIECCVNALRSMIDILMQVINVVILDKEAFPAKDVTFGHVEKGVMKNPEYSNVSKSLDLLIKDKSFIYINAFNNFNKHRGSLLFHNTFSAEFGKDKRNEWGVEYKNFILNNREYPSMWGSDIIGIHRKQIMDLILKIGVAINEDMKNQWYQLIRL